MSNKSYIEKPISKKQLKVLSALLVSIFSFMFYVCGSVFFEELSNIEKIRDGHIYIGNRDLAFGAIFFIPVLAVLDYMFILVLLDKFKDNVMKLFIKIAFISIPVMIISSITYSFWVGSELRANGYSHCTAYGSATRGTPSIWVKSEQYCQERAWKIRIELYEYFDHWDQKKQEPTEEELNAAILTMLENNPFYRLKHGLSDLKKRQPL
ncbi:hypothetical protein Q4601_02695 [Shewanella sp. 1_MG-2023]|uniref:hypothetical protein n=1 Tax=unclassified Shewanella TaxID=196818 RepID=UPI0026E2BE4F|nr:MULTISPECIES: hypothetical protein [unclassified Shewanella]MDO6610659.1 hypothetical protein [Shewanella sp. 7_MG-2023]MDO6770784.1 hypothetical protein [Shewanella sp. 2_MG-2023]MDO6793198.1 hypothetical protein [Shewanella sp. 1_MG-2023]